MRPALITAFAKSCVCVRVCVRARVCVQVVCVAVCVYARVRACVPLALSP